MKSITKREFRQIVVDVLEDNGIVVGAGVPTYNKALGAKIANDIVEAIDDRVHGAFGKPIVECQYMKRHDAVEEKIGKIAGVTKGDKGYDIIKLRPKMYNCKSHGCGRTVNVKAVTANEASSGYCPECYKSLIGGTKVGRDIEEMPKPRTPMNVLTDYICTGCHKTIRISAVTPELVDLSLCSRCYTKKVVEDNDDNVEA